MLDAKIVDSMKKTPIYIMMAVLVSCLIACGSKASNGRATTNATPKERVSKPQYPPLNVYNMGGVPPKDVEGLVKKLQSIYPNTHYSGELAFVDSTKSKNDPKGNNRYLGKKLGNHLKKTTDTKKGITLVIVNAEVCTWNNEKNESHATFGASNLGGHISTISYQRLKVNRLNNVNELTKVVIHELGHSVARLVGEREDLRHHCPHKTCLMRDAKGGYPYKNLTTFCPDCTKKMKAHGFNVESLRLTP